MAKKATPDGDVIDVGDSLEVTQTKEDGQSLLSFIKGIQAFFTTAAALEKKATDHLSIVKALKAPETEAEDLAVQEIIKQSTTMIKEVDEHWTITGVVFGFHKKLVAARDRVVGEATKSRNAGTLMQAREIAQGHHNRYAEQERRRAAEEQERLRVAEETRQREAQEAEARRLEAEAAAKEIASPDLSDREALFVDYVFSGMLPTPAAKKCGYKDAETMADRLMKLGKIKKAITAKEEAKVAREQAEAVRQKPVEVEVEAVRPAIAKPTGGGYDRTTWGGEVLDLNRFRDAAFDGGYGIPRDCFVVDQTKLNDYGKSMKQLLDKWPGVRHTKKTTTV